MPSQKAPRRFISPYERRRRIEGAMRRKVSEEYPEGWTWYKLAKEMNTSGSVVDRAFKIGSRSGETHDVTLRLLIRCARALDVSVGFLVDQTPTTE